MSLVTHLPVIFLVSSSFVVATASIVKIDRYETNTLLSFNDHYSKVFLSPDSFKYLKLQDNSWFDYYEGGKEMTRRVVSIMNRTNGYEIVLDDNSYDKKLTTISYKSGKQNLLSSLFNL